MELVDEVYMAVKTLPKSELYGLSQQMRTAAVSIPSNIAESRGRRGFREEQQFVRHARGSTYELQTQIEIAIRQGFLEPTVGADLAKLADRVGCLVNALLRIDET